MSRQNILLIGKAVEATVLDLDLTHTVEVRGPKTCVCEENLASLKHHFQAILSDPGAVKEIMYVRERNSVLLTFENEEGLYLYFPT